MPARTMSAQPRLELVTSQDALFDEVVSPELVLVDPELAERARARLVLPQSPTYVVPRPVVPRALPPPEAVPLRGELRPAVLEADVASAVLEAPERTPVVVALPQPAPAPIPLVVESPVTEPLPVPPAPIVEQPPPVVVPPEPPRPSRNRAGKLRLVAAGIVIGLCGGVVAADV